jgi:hypothetical protein
VSGVREKVILGLASTGKPAHWQKLPAETDPPPQYFIFNTMTTPSDYADNKATNRSRHVYLEYYSDTAFEESFVAQIRSGMEAQGFDSVDERDVSSKYGYQLSMTWFCREAV